MELTLEHAISPAGLVGHSAYILTVISMLMRSMVWLRILYLISSIFGIIYVGVWIHDPVGFFWRIVLISVNVCVLLWIFLGNYAARFTAEEADFRASLLRGLNRGEARRLLNLGEWLDLPDGATLTREGEGPDHLYYIARGRALISTDGRVVARCEPGQYVGEMSMLDRAPASADARADGPVRTWRISRATLDRIALRRPKIHAVVEAGIARDMRVKIVRGNLGAGAPAGTPKALGGTGSQMGLVGD